MKGSKIFGLLLALAVLAVGFMLPTSEEITRNGVLSACVLISVLVLLLSEAIPVALAALFGPTALILLRVATPGQAFFGFSNHILYFILASAVISHGLSSTNLSKRMLCAMLRKFGGSVNSVVVGIMVCTAILSALMSNVATVLIFLPLCMDFIGIYDNEEDKRRTGRALMLALPISTGVGCVFTPAGSSLHLLVLGQLEQLTGLTVPFLSWMLVGIPWVAFVLPIAILLVLKLNKPAPISREKLDAFIKTLPSSEKFSFKEKYVLVVILSVLALWMIGTWFPRLQITAVAIIGITFLAAPGFEGLSWKDIEPKLPWTIILLVGSFISMANALTITGAAAWITNNVIPTSLNLPPIAIGFIAALVVFLLLLLVPLQPAVIPLLSIPFVALAGVANVNPIAIMMVLAFTVSTSYLLPYESVPLLTYMKGYYKKSDLAKTSLLLQLWIGVVTALWVPFIVGVLGL